MLLIIKGSIKHWWLIITVGFILTLMTTKAQLLVDEVEFSQLSPENISAIEVVAERLEPVPSEIKWSSNDALLLGSRGLWLTDVDLGLRAEIVPDTIRANDLAIDLPNQVVAYVGPIDIVNLLDLETGEARQFESLYTLALAFSPDGSILVTGDAAAVVRLWDVETLALLATLDYEDEAVTYVMFSHDGEYLVTGWAGYPPRIWSVQEALEAEDVLTNDSAPALETTAITPDVVIHPTGDLYATSVSINLSRSQISRWRQDDVFVERPIQPEPQIIGEYAYTIVSLAFTPAGDVLAMGTDEGEILFIDPETGDLLGMLDNAHGEESVADLAFNPAGTVLASSGWDNYVRTWALPVEE
jgi:WD40 repeat protein